MTSESECQPFPASPIGGAHKHKKQSKLSYTREFLLSFSELDICKQLPAGFDKSVLSEFEDASHNSTEWQRVPGGLPLQSSKRSEYGTSPPNTYSRSSHGRWDVRSSASNDRDADTQFDRESDTGRRYGSQSRRSWQNHEHDGLLGSGAFPRPSGYNAIGHAVSRVRGEGQYQLNRTSEPYQPPRPYKAMPHTRRDNTDMLNDETFGNSECSNQDRAEEERKRRASFELMRKEQQKVLQEKQTHGQDKPKDQIGSDISVLLENSEAEGTSWSNKPDRFEDTQVDPLSETDSIKSSSAIQAAGARPLIPPGFRGTVTEKNFALRPAVPSPEQEVATSAVEGSVMESNPLLIENALCNTQDQVTRSLVPEDCSEKNVIPLSDVGISDYNAVHSESLKARKISDLREVDTTWPDSSVTNFEADKAMMGDGGVMVSQGASILQKLFDSALTLNTVSSLGLSEPATVKPNEDSWNPMLSSKFAYWFLDEETKVVDDLSSSKAKDLLSLISEKNGSHVSAPSEQERDITEPILLENNELPQKLIIPGGSSAPLDASLPVLTCEDLEQAILAEATKSSSTPQKSAPGRIWDSKVDPNVEVDDHASQHLLSLLRKGTCSKEPSSIPNLDIGAMDKTGAGLTDAEEVNNTEKTLTLETLFGSAFMKELQSVGAPLSVQRGSTNVESADNEYAPNKVNHEVNIFNINHTEAKTDMIQGYWLGFDNHKTDASSLMHTGLEDKVDGTLDIQLPEEESLISVSDSMEHKPSKAEDFLSLKAPVEMTGKLTALDAIIKRERPALSCFEGGPPVYHEKYDPIETELLHQHIRGHPSSTQFPQHHHARPFFQQPLDQGHRTPHMVDEDSILYHDLHNPFTPSIHHPYPFHGAGGPRFDPPHHPSLPQMPHTTQNFPLPHMIQGLPRGVPLSHPINQMGGYISQEMAQVHGFTMNHRQPNFSGSGMGLPGTIVGGGNHPESLERLEMELRANMKQQNFPVGAGQGPGLYGPPELDMRFRFR